MRSFRLFACLLLAATLLAAQDDGRKWYLSQCSACHGMEGGGGRGPSLNRPTLVHAPDDDALYRVIRYGIEGTEMPRTWLSPDKIRAVVRHVRSLGRVEQPPLPGDVERGRREYAAAGCASCHTIRGRGGAIGPDLNAIGASRSARHLKDSLQSPGAHITPGFGAVRVAANSGEAVLGVLVNGATFSVQLRDLSGAVHSFWQSELAGVEAAEPRSLMPAYRGERIDDLVAYLAGLRGAR